MDTPTAAGHLYTNGRRGEEVDDNSSGKSREDPVAAAVALTCGSWFGTRSPSPSPLRRAGGPPADLLAALLRAPLVLASGLWVLLALLLPLLDASGECAPFCLTAPPIRAALSVSVNAAAALALLAALDLLATAVCGLAGGRREGGAAARAAGSVGAAGLPTHIAVVSGAAAGTAAAGASSAAARCAGWMRDRGLRWAEARSRHRLTPLLSAAAACVVANAALTLLLWSASSISRRDLLHLWPPALLARQRLHFRPFSLVPDLLAIHKELQGSRGSAQEGGSDAGTAAAASASAASSPFPPAPRVILVQYHSNSLTDKIVARALANTRRYAERHGYGFVDGVAWYSAAGLDGSQWNAWPMEGPLQGLVGGQGGDGAASAGAVYDLSEHKASNWAKVKLLAAVLSAVDGLRGDAGATSPSSSPPTLGPSQEEMLGPGLRRALSSDPASPVWLLWLDADALVLNHSVRADEVVAAALDDEALDAFAALQATHGGLGSLGKRQVAAAAAEARQAAPSSSSSSSVDLILTFSLARAPASHYAADALNTGVFALRCSTGSAALLREMWHDWRYDQLPSEWVGVKLVGGGGGGSRPKDTEHRYEQVEQGAMQERVASGGVRTELLMQATAHPLLRRRTDLGFGCFGDDTSLAGEDLSSLLLLRADDAGGKTGVGRGTEREGTYPAPFPPWMAVGAAAAMPVVPCRSLPLSSVRVFSQAGVNTFPGSWEWAADRTREGDWIAHPAGDAWKTARVAAFLTAVEAARAEEEARGTEGGAGAGMTTPLVARLPMWVTWY
jgi:hypothetical protein